MKAVDKGKEVLSLSSNVTITDNTIAVIDNCKQILECNEILAKVFTNKFEIEIWGEGLSLSNFCTDAVEVKGKIKSINIIPKGKKEK